MGKDDVLVNIQIRRLSVKREPLKDLVMGDSRQFFITKTKEREISEKGYYFSDGVEKKKGEAIEC